MHACRSTLEDPTYRGLWGLLTLALGGGIIFASRTYGANDLTAAVLTAAVLAAGAAVAMVEWRSTRPLAFMAAAAVAFTALLSAGVIPRLSDLAVSTRLAAAIAPYKAASSQPVAMAGYSEPSVVFLLGTDTILTGTASVVDYMLAHPGAVGVIEAAQVEEVSRAVAGSGGLRKLADIEGYNYSRGDPVALSVVTIAAPDAQP